MKAISVSLIVLILFTHCKKNDTSCKTYTEVAGQAHLVDINTINVPEFRSIIDQYPQLQVYRFNENDVTWSMKCHVFYHGLPVFTDFYSVFKNKLSGEVFTYDTLRPITMASLEPGVSYEDAIREAKRHENFDHTCISYCLGIYNIYAGAPHALKNDKLVWRIEGEKGYPYVVLDAYTKEVYVSEDGIVIN